MAELNSQAEGIGGLFAGAASRVETVDAQLRRQYAGRPAEEIVPQVREALEAIGVYITGTEKARKYAEAISQGKPFRTNCTNPSAPSATLGAHRPRRWPPLRAPRSPAARGKVGCSTAC